MTDVEKIVGLLLLMLGGGKRALASTSKPSTAAPSTPGGGDDGLKLVARANQVGLSKWTDLFIQQDVPPELARALTRWAGIESSGDPTAVSPLGERGLLQVGKAMFSDLVKAGVFKEADWDKLSAATTTNEEHARMAYTFANWLWKRAYRLIRNEPTDTISAAWYAKLYHQRPVDVRDGQMHGPALLMSRELKERWKHDAAKMHRLRAANVVAFGVPEP